MSNYQPTDFNQFNTAEASATASKTFMTNVFSLMAGALLITGIIAYVFAHIPSLSEMLYRVQDGRITGYAPLGWVCMIAPFVLVLAMGAGFNRFSAPVLMLLFVLYSALQGAFLSSIFLRYDIETIGATFGISAGMFGVMAVMGYITKADLSRFGSILMMAVFGLVIAVLVNYFMHSSTMSYLISIAGVAIFTGLTAWDVQRLKQIGAGTTYGQEGSTKLAILGALTLYLDFINIFLFLLRLMGNRR